MFADKFNCVSDGLSSIVRFMGFREGDKPFILKGFVRVSGATFDLILVFLLVVVLSVNGGLGFSAFVSTELPSISSV